MWGLYSQVHYLCYAPVWGNSPQLPVSSVWTNTLAWRFYWLVRTMWVPSVAHRSSVRLLRSAPEERRQRIHRCRAELDPSSQGRGERNPSVLPSHLILLRDPFAKSQTADANKAMAAKEVNGEANTHISTRLTITPQRLSPPRKESRASEQKAQAKLCKWIPRNASVIIAAPEDRI